MIQDSSSTNQICILAVIALLNLTKNGSKTLKHSPFLALYVLFCSAEIVSLKNYVSCFQIFLPQQRQKQANFQFYVPKEDEEKVK